MPMQMKLLQPVTAVAIGAPVAMNATPFLGGKGRNATLSLGAQPTGTTVVLLQGAPKTAAGGLPVPGDASWYTIATFNATNDIEGEFELPDYIRANTTVLQAAAPDLDIFLYGVQ